jgi:lipid-A-disaccharide synthase
LCYNSSVHETDVREGRVDQTNCQGEASRRVGTRLFFSVGDVSADLHAANLIRAIRAKRPDVIIEGLGGPRMAEAGCRLLDDMTTMNVMWFTNVLSVIRRARRLQREALAHVSANRPDAVVMLDFPGFNLSLARRLKKLAAPVLYYISPQIWAWRPGRIHKIKRLVGKMLCIFPFEEKLYRSAGVPVEYVGHPLFDHLASLTLDEDFRRSLREAGEPVIGLLPGSRRQEIRDLLPAMARAAALIRAEFPKAAFVVACPGEEQETLATEVLQRYDFPARVVAGRTFEVMAESDLCLIKAGTGTMELTHFGTPMVILYRVNVPGKLLDLLMRRTKHIGMPNILLGREAVPERLLWRDQPKEVAGLALDILRRPERRDEMRRTLAELRATIDWPGASERAADAVLRFADESQGRTTP